MSVFQIQMEIQTITFLFWAVWGSLSVVTGFIVLVMPVAGFGTVADYLRCWLWVLGYPWQDKDCKRSPRPLSTHSWA